MQNYDTIIIGAGQSDLAPNPSPAGRGNALLENKKAPVFHRGLGGFMKPFRLVFPSISPRPLLPIEYAV